MPAFWCPENGVSSFNLPKVFLISCHRSGLFQVLFAEVSLELVPIWLLLLVTKVAKFISPSKQGERTLTWIRMHSRAELCLNDDRQHSIGMANKLILAPKKRPPSLYCLVKDYFMATLFCGVCSEIFQVYDEYFYQKANKAVVVCVHQQKEQQQHIIYVKIK